MDKFEIPTQLQEVLDQDRALSGLVDTSLSEFGIWLGQNNVKFFTEYTDHSLGHVRDVLKTADELIREGSRAYLTAADVATLVLATLLHDCAMHLAVDGFIKLVQSDNETTIQGFGDKSWRLLWLDFLAESRRFSGRKLMALFGDTQPAEHPPLDHPEKMTGRDLMLCGEFLRRHHHRLAHEIAIHGVPGPEEDNKLKLPHTDDTKHIIDIAGLVARSHGLSMRDCFGYLDTQYTGTKLVRGIHPVFMMALLRIADILQLQSERAPKQVQKVRELQSPVSSGEWEMHQAIKDIDFSKYPETMYIDARPENVKTYLRIRRQLDDIQHELDSSWTVIGEVYAYDPKFREMGLTIRRVRSNIDDLKTFSKQVPYIPTQASFEVADTDLLKLLVGPLYGYKPEIGIRELMQNAIDAVNELKQYRQQRPDLGEIDLTNQEGDVVVSIGQELDGTWWLTVSDRGIGMTAETVCEYFLKAGASLRRSEQWKKTFEDENGKSQVLRSGRFGIGALAVFLIGDNIHLSTRYVNADKDDGVEFTAQLDEAAIELRPANRPVGTTIRIQLSEDIKETLTNPQIYFTKTEDAQDKSAGWDWYRLAEPKIVRKIQTRLFDQKYLLPMCRSVLPVDWHRIRHEDFEDVVWSYSNIIQITCNGILVGDNPNFPGYTLLPLKEEPIPFVRPNISVFDFNAKFPLDLQRTSLSVDNLPFAKELLEDVIRNFIAWILHAPGNSIMSLSDPQKTRTLGIYDYAGRDSNCSLWFSTKSSLGIAADPWFLNEVNLKSALVVFSNFSGASSQILDVDLPESLIKFENYLNETSLLEMDNAILKGLGIAKMPDGLHREAIFKDLYVTPSIGEYIPAGGRLLISKKILSDINILQRHSDYLGFSPLSYLGQSLKVIKTIDFNNLYGISRLGFENDLFTIITVAIEQEWENDHWVILKAGNCPAANFDFITFASNHDSLYASDKSGNAGPNLLAEWYFDEKPKFEMSTLAKIWKELIGSPMIPLDMKERRRKLARAYKELKPYIEAHEAHKAENKLDD